MAQEILSCSHCTWRLKDAECWITKQIVDQDRPSCGKFVLRSMKKDGDADQAYGPLHTAGLPN